MASAQDVFTLKNGMRVVVDEDNRFPLVSMRLYVRAGSSMENPGQEGMSHFLEHMAFKGSAGRLPGQAAREIESAGGSINAGTSFDYTVYTLDLPAQKLQLGLDILQDMVFGATLDQKEFDLEKQVVLAEIQRSMDNPSSRVFQSVQSRLWADTPYSHPILGSTESVKAMSPEDMRQYMHRHYQPGQTVLSVSGDVQSGKVLEAVRAMFEDVKNRGYHRSLPVLATFSPADNPVHIMHGPWQKAYLAVALPAGTLNSPRNAALDLLAQLLGGDSTSLFYRQFKYETGLVDDISARNLSLDRAGMLYFHVRMDPDKVKPFWEKFVPTLAGLDVSAFTREDLNRARISLEENVYRSRETLGGKASWMGFDLLLKKDVRSRDRYLEELQRVTLEDLESALEDFIHMHQAVAAILLPEEVPAAGDMFRIEREVSEDTAEPGKPGEDKSAKPLVRDLGHGRTLAVLPDDSLPYTALRIAWPGGDALISPQQQGLAELSASALTRETTERSYTRIQEFLKNRGASLGASAGRESLSLSARFPVRYSRDMFDLIQEVITRPAFSPQELQRAVDNQVASIREQEDRPLGYAFRHLFPFLFESGTNGYLHLGKEDYLLAVQPEEVREFWNRQRQKPFVMALSGQVDTFELEEFVSRMQELETVRPTPAPESIWAREKHKQSRLKDRTQAHLLKVYPVAGKTHEDTAGLKVLNKILAGQGGMLFRELRDRQGLAYSVTSMLWQTPETGFLALYIGTFADKTGEALEGFQEIVQDIRTNPPDPGEVERGANLLFGEYHRGRQTLSSRAGEASSLLVQGLDLDFRKEQINRSRKLTPEDILELARKYLVPENSYLFEILPE
ncbi:pitrilysin family protein [Desulfonatronospira sp.]|uniref:M16 family metallopeptidase n=1 Tax=Desulfonatronospira sp. TaxID=1962951 RepID=UPI0025B966F8|nr:pitrilysin family protein [Desulfonatronospira sp.]